MSVKPITDILHEYMTGNLNDSPETEEEKKTRYLNKKKTRTNNETGDKPAKFKNIDCNRCGAPNWSRQHECPDRGKKCAKCGKIGHFAKSCRSNKKIYHIQDEETGSAEKDECAPVTIHSIEQKIHSTQPTSISGPEFFTLKALVNNGPINFIIDSGSPVTLIPKSLFDNITPLQPLETEHRDVNDNRINFEGETIAKVNENGKQKHLEVLISTEKTNPLLGLDWMKELGITLDKNNTDQQKLHVKEDPDIKSLKGQFKKLFNENHTVKAIKVEIELKECAKLIQQKVRPIPIHLQQSFEKEIEKLKSQGHIEKANDNYKNCFVSPAVITV